MKRARFLTVDFYILLVLKWSSKICIEKYYSENKITLHTVRTPKRPLIVTFPTVLNVSKNKKFLKFSKTNKKWQILKNKTSVAETFYFKNLFQIFQLVFVKMSFVEISTKKSICIKWEVEARRDEKRSCYLYLSEKFTILF